MGRHSKHIPDEPQGKGITHYVNGVNRDDGMHDGIRKNCATCAMYDLISISTVINTIWETMPENPKYDDENWIWE
jgi:hypothetical protein